MTHTTYTARTAPHRGTVALTMVEQWIRHCDKVRPVRLVGTGKRTANDDHTGRVRAILDALRVKYTTGNDAPRGGRTGDYIQPDRASWRKLQPVRDAWEAERIAKASKAEQEARERLKAQEEQREREALALAQWKSQGETGATLLLQWGLFAAKHSLSIRLAPAEVVAEKERLGLSWNKMRELRKPLLA